MDVVVVGSCMNDLTSYAPKLPRQGETLHGHKFSVGFGGKGANQCVAASRLGASTAMVARVGDDYFGQNYIQHFKNSNINAEHVRATKEASTGVAAISVDDAGQNCIIIVSGANLLLTEADVIAAESMIAAAKVVVCQLEIKSEVTLATLKLARKHGVRTILNPAPGVKELDPEMYMNCDIFCPNETETEILTGLSVTKVDETEAAVSVLLERGCKAVILTLGAQGAVVATQDDKKTKHVPACCVSPVDTTGAGDSFVGAVAYYLARHDNLSLEEVVWRACEVATQSVLVHGAQSSPCRDNVSPELFL